MAATFIPISFGWAAGDVSLAAYIQSSMARVESRTTGVSALGAVMSFLYVTYITIYAILSPTLGTYIDSQIAQTNVWDAFYNVAGIQFTVLSVIILLATLIPKGAIGLNPALLDNEVLDQDLVEDGLGPAHGEKVVYGEGDKKDGSSSASDIEKEKEANKA